MDNSKTYTIKNKDVIIIPEENILGLTQLIIFLGICLNLIKQGKISRLKKAKK